MYIRKSSYSVDRLVDLINTGRIVLPDLSLDVSDIRSTIIETVLLRGNVDNMYISYDSKVQTRLAHKNNHIMLIIYKFLKNEFKLSNCTLYPELDGKSFLDLPRATQRLITETYLPIYEVVDYYISCSGLGKDKIDELLR